MKMNQIAELDRILKAEYKKHRAPIVELEAASGADPFKILVATILSARTKDETTAAAVTRLFKIIKSYDDLRRIPRAKLEKTIFPTGFYRTKAKHLKELPDVLDKKFTGKIPSTIEELCELPGVGRKTANLVVSAAFDKPGICVDVHVHRICNRLGLLKSKTPLETEMLLRKKLPLRYWKTFNKQLVSFGQTTCTPLRPKCGECPAYPLCSRINVKT